MGYVKMNCPSCGASLEHNGDKDFFFCEYCGTKIAKDVQYMDVSVSGIANEKSLLERANLFLEDRKFRDADKYFNRVLDINPHCSKAYIGRLLCELHISDINELSHNHCPLTQYDNFNKALRFASENERKLYNSYSELIITRKTAHLKDIITSTSNEIKHISAELESIQQRKDDINTKNRSSLLSIRLWLILKPIIIFIISGISLATLIVSIVKSEMGYLAILCFTVYPFITFISIIIGNTITQKSNALLNIVKALDKEHRRLSAKQKRLIASHNNIVIEYNALLKINKK